MVEKAQTVVVLADSSKFGKIGFINVAPLTNIDIIITNEISEDYKNVLSRLGVKLIIV